MIRERTQMAVGCSLAVVAVLVLVLLFSSGCGSWQTTTTKALAGLHQSLAGASAVAEPAFESRCKAAARSCTAKPCAAADACLEDLDAFTKVILSGRALIHLGQGAVALGDEKGAKATLAKAATVAAEVATLLAKARIIPGGAR